MPDKTITPVAVFTYNRPAHTDRALESLSRCRRLDECRIFIYCDGARKPEHREGVDACRKVVAEWAGRLGADVILREDNYGLARSIVSGVSDLCAMHRRVIVVEDDLVLGSDFIDFMLNGLSRYENNPEVMQVSGYLFPQVRNNVRRAFFLPMTTTWGWATWGRAWQLFSWNAEGYRELLDDKKQRRDFDLDGSYPYSQMLQDRMEGKNDSWGILWWYAVFKAKGYVLYPPSSLVANTGFDGSGVHCGDIPEMQKSEASALEAAGTIGLPGHIEIDRKMYEHIKRTCFVRAGPEAQASAICRLLGLLGLRPQ